jgi:hypothetical protein
MDSPTPTGPVEPTSVTPPAPAPEIDPLKLQDFVRRRRDQQNLGMAILGGAIGAALGAALWAGITAAFEGRQIGFMAIGVGFLVGFAVRYLGKGMDPIFGVVGAVFSLIGCVAGNILAVMLLVSTQEHIPFATIAAKMSPTLAWTMLTDTFSPIDLLFYGLALYFGYRYSFHPISQAELASLKS